ncbi:MAG: hypothetical protein DRI94_06850 [Bacteroidetes bacterium]|nr:MAG: hypothetical protein DRI94_06850 [Bacteroidota bacterium]
MKPNLHISDISDKTAEKFFRKKTTLFRKKYNNFNGNPEEIIKKIKRKTLSFAALYGTLGVLFLYIPQYLFPGQFADSEYTIPFINYKIEFSIFGLFYGFFLVGVEIWYLMKGDLKSTGEIAALYGFNPDEKKTETTELVKIALNKDRKKYTEIGINPYQNFSKPGLFLIRLMYLVKAFLSNFVFKIIIKRVIGRLAIREVVDMAGIPIYAFWNAYASAQIIRKTDMRMKASVMIIKLAKHFKTKYENNTDFSKLLYDTFEFIALTKKSFYPSDLIFAKHFLKTFNIKIKDEHRLSEGYFETVKSLPEDIKLGIGQLLVLGFLLDGKIGTFEIKIIKKLKTDKIIPYSVEEIKTWTKNYTLGHGFEEMYIE